MVYKQDWMLRKIQLITDLIAHTVFHTSVVKYERENAFNPTDTDKLCDELDALVEQKELGEAEDLLLDSIDAGNRKHLELALDFYRKINKFDDEELDLCDFPRSEIMDGIETVIEIFGLTDIAQ
jgi:hypothetical protein